ncbi:MAG: sialate O-acetylesterase [Verrucomicrobia bacterium]|nr:sialate O-acetylesterase [Verrucomicrobiota bacterium]
MFTSHLFTGVAWKPQWLQRGRGFLAGARRGMAALGAPVLALGMLTLGLQAEVRLPALFTDRMVLQQGQTVPVWGWADEGEAVTVEFRGQTQTTTAAQGRWQVRLKAVKAGGPDVLVVRGKNRLEVQDVLVGEVWVCSGQSNMEWPLTRSHEPQADIAGAANANLRLFTVPKLKALAPVEDVQSAWRLCGPDTVASFSAVGYYFGRALQTSRQVPVGLIHTSWGGSPAEVWMSEATLNEDPEWKRDILETSRAAVAAYESAVAQWEKEKAEAEKEGKPFDKRRPGLGWRATELYNGMIAPLLPYGIRGAIWYQGESNAGRAFQYRRLFADMIRNWRSDWGQGDFPFLAVQLAPWDKNRKRALGEITAAPGESDWAELREAQGFAAKLLPEVGLAVITDVGDKDDIHPAKKQPVGERLALAARVIAYGERIHGLSPTFRSVRFDGPRAIIRFQHAADGLEARGGELTGFAIASADRKFVWAKAVVQGNRVVVSSPSVPEPAAVRFGWADYPVINLFSKGGLPVSPFRTDDFPMVTGPKR